jgi:hypothetical protein
MVLARPWALPVARGRWYLDRHPRVARAVSTGMLVVNIGMLLLMAGSLTIVAFR